MGTRQIRHMDIIANPGPIRRGIVSTKDADMAAFAQRCFYRHLDEVGCPRCRLSGATLRISARHIEIAQGAEVEIMRSEEHTSELQSLMRISYAVFCLKKKTNQINIEV